MSSGSHLRSQSNPIQQRMENHSIISPRKIKEVHEKIQMLSQDYKITNQTRPVSSHKNNYYQNKYFENDSQSTFEMQSQQKSVSQNPNVIITKKVSYNNYQSNQVYQTVPKIMNYTSVIQNTHQVRDSVNFESQNQIKLVQQLNMLEQDLELLNQEETAVLNYQQSLQNQISNIESSIKKFSLKQNQQLQNFKNLEIYFKDLQNQNAQAENQIKQRIYYENQFNIEKQNLTKNQNVLNEQNKSLDYLQQKREELQIEYNDFSLKIICLPNQNELAQNNQELENFIDILNFQIEQINSQKEEDQIFQVHNQQIVNNIQNIKMGLPIVKQNQTDSQNFVYKKQSKLDSHINHVKQQSMGTNLLKNQQKVDFDKLRISNLKQSIHKKYKRIFSNENNENIANDQVNVDSESQTSSNFKNKTNNNENLNEKFQKQFFSTQNEISFQNLQNKNRNIQNLHKKNQSQYLSIQNQMSSQYDQKNKFQNQSDNYFGESIFQLK